ncbi:hypothetical protein CBR_g290 [Chara braunii]|uniref:Condensin complex subunit 1 C-terminal domain-containing protein n=1 Tax=Chara braunii TaxID=69332 RepID=A0A388JQB4_CHABU|nr:hypothetical protein CBR_g290 [Chara braunii]|eukprot:GBG59958.1 hypothetical protein CBR_g290 [Chara braunii]
MVAPAMGFVDELRRWVSSMSSDDELRGWWLGGVVQLELLLSLCELVNARTVVHLPLVVSSLEDSFEVCVKSEPILCKLLHCVSLAGWNLTTPSRACKRGTGSLAPVPFKRKPVASVSEQMTNRVADLVSEVINVHLAMWQSRSELADAIGALIWLDGDSAKDLMEPFIALLHDPEYRVRRRMARLVAIPFRVWSNHTELLDILQENLGVRMVRAIHAEAISQDESETIEDVNMPMAETAVVALGEVATASAKVEDQVVFMLCAHAGLRPQQSSLVQAVLDRLAIRCGYSHRCKYMAHHVQGVLCCWVTVGIPLRSLFEARNLFVENMTREQFSAWSVGSLLPPLLLSNNASELNWLAQASGLPLRELLNQAFAYVFAALLPMHCSAVATDQERARQVLQGTLLEAAQLTEAHRDEMIRKRMENDRGRVGS